MADTTVQDRLIALVREHFPAGLLKRSNEMLLLWVEAAANEINQRRKKTTRKETSITLDEDETAYDLPEDCVKVVNIVLEDQEGCCGGGLSVNQFPLESQGYGCGFLPSGQRISRSLDVIQRQEASRQAQEVAWRIEASQIVIEFRPSTGAILKVVYIAEDNSVETLPQRHHLLVLVYCRMQAMTAQLEQIAGSSDHVGDRLLQMNLGEIAKARDNLRAEWREGLALITPETD